MTKNIDNKHILGPSSSFREAIHNELAKTNRFLGDEYPDRMYERIKDEFEYALVLFMLNDCGGNIVGISRKYGVYAKTVYNTLEKFEIDHHLFKMTKRKKRET